MCSFHLADTHIIKFTGLVDAHTGEVVRSWNGLQHGAIRAITGNKKIGKEFVDINVEQTGRYSCKHRDAKRRVEVWNESVQKFPTFANSENTIRLHN